MIFRAARILCASLLVAVGVSGVATSAAPRTIPLQPYLREQATVRASVNGISGTFLFDTGEGLSAISPAFAKEIGCRSWGQVSGFRMSGERLDNAHCDNLVFDFAGERRRAPSVMTLDIMKFIGPDVPKVDGALGLDLFAGKTITIRPRKAIIIETKPSLARRIAKAKAKAIPIRLVRDVEGLALSIDAPVKTASGLAWMELDTGNGGSIVIANHIAPLVGLQPDAATPSPGRIVLANGIVVEGNMRTRDLIMDGNIGAQFLNRWNLTLDLARGRAWLTPANAN